MVLYCHEKTRLGIELALSNCSGWSSSGGPWVKLEDSMKHIVFTVRLLHELPPAARGAPQK